MMKKITTQVPALDKVVDICDYLSDKKGATFTQIYQGLNMAKSTTSSLLSGMITHGLIRQVGDKYCLGLRLYELGNKAIQQFDIKNIAMPVLVNLRDSTELTCHLGVLEGNTPIYLAKLESPRAIVIRSWEGKRLSLHSSGLGKALMAWLTVEERNALLTDEETLPRYTGTTITDKRRLNAELALVRQRGWAYDNEEDSEGVRCIAVPVFDGNQRVIAAISVSGVSFQLPENHHEEIATLLAQAARTITDKIK